MDVTQLINSWTKASFTPSTTSLTVNGGTAPVSITHGQAVTFNVNVAGAGGTPTGEVAIVGNANQEANTSNSNWISTYTLLGGATDQSYSNLPGGTYTISANYGGDIAFAQSQSSPAIQVTVAKENSVLNLAAQTFTGNVTPAASYPYGTYITLDATPVGQSQVSSANPGYATGSVVFTDTAGLPSGVSGTAAINSFGYAELPLYYLSTTAHTIGASYAGDNSFLASTAAPISFTIVPAATVSAVTSSLSSVSSGTFTVTSVITPSPASGAAAPTGTVTLALGSGSIGSGPVVAAQDPNTGASLGTATITVTASSLAAGANTITAGYSGDANYSSSSGTVIVTLTVTPPIGSIALTPAPTGVTISSPGQSGTSTVSVTPTNYTGTLNLTCVLATSPSGANATYNPTCTVPATLAISSSTVATTTASVATTAPTSGALTYPETNRERNHWYTTAGGAALACLLFFGIPARRRGWKSLLSLMVFLVAMAGVGCGGGGGGNNNSGTPGTTVGSYTFTVTATDSKTSTITNKGTITVTVN